MEAFEKRLKQDVENKVGFKILSTTDARALLVMLQEQEIFDLSLSTIRRFWGLIPHRRPIEKTLNSLALFLGYKTYMDYVKSKNRFVEWFNISELQRLKFKQKLTRSDFRYIESLYTKESSTFASVSLFEHALNFKKWNCIEDLFNPKNIGLLKDHKDATEYSAKQAYLIFLYLNSVPKAYFETSIDPLLHIDGFRYFCVYLYVDVINLNHRYGAILDKINSLRHKTEEETLFINLLRNLRRYLNGKNPKSIAFDQTILRKLPFVLIGRYYGYQILYNTLENNETEVELHWNLFLSGIGPNTDVRQYLNEFTHHLLLAKCFSKLEYIMDNFYEEIMDNFHLHHYLDVFFFGLIDVIISYRSGDVKRANIIFSNLDVSKIIYGSYCDYYLIFYNLIGFHLASAPEEKFKYKKDYSNLAKEARFSLFSEQYLEDYFLEDRDEC